MKAVGSRLPRYDGLNHVTSRSRYVDDVRVPNMLWAKAHRSPVASARIVRIDTSRAERMPGVQAVVTHRDVLQNVVGHLEARGVPADEPLLAEHEVRYVGQPIAAVAAESEDAALAAVDAIIVEYEEREPFLEVRKAFDPDQPQVTPQGNVRYYYPDQAQQQVRKGDVDGAFDAADFIVDGVYRPAAIEQAPTETQVALSVPEPGGRLIVYSTTQAMYLSMDVVARHLELPLSRLKFVGGTLGGAFGGKVDTVAEAISAVLAVKAQRPVKWRWTREEEMLTSSTRAAYHVEVADAVTKDGWILGRRTLTLHDAGAYTRFSSYGATKHTFHLAGAYTIPNIASDTFVVWTNRVPSSAMRGFGVTSVSFAIETHMGRVAEVIGMDPWELRLKNANRVGDTSPTRSVYNDPSTVSTLLAAAGAAGVNLDTQYEAMTGKKREGDLLPEHLVGQQKEPEPQPLAWEGSKPGGMDGGDG